MARIAAPPLEQTPEDGIAHLGSCINDGHERLDFLRRKELRVDPVQTVGLAAAANFLEIMDVVREMKQTALAEHYIEIELSAQTLP